jgi:hypothetical protein
VPGEWRDTRGIRTASRDPRRAPLGRVEPVGGGLVDEGGLADARLDPDQPCVTVAPGEVAYWPVEQRKLVDATRQHDGRGYRMHGMKRTNCASDEQAERFRTLIR